MSITRIINVSGGKASGVALIRTIERFGAVNCKARFADTRQESADLYRFLDDLERVTGVEIVRLDQGKDCWDIWFEQMMMTNPETGGCLASYHLKRLPLAEHAASIATPETSTIYVGFGPDEDDRQERLLKAGAPWRFDFPLTWKPRLFRCDVTDELHRRGIKPGKVYDAGYAHDNCKGACIRAGIRQWAGLLKDDPDTYRHNEEKEQEFIRRLQAMGRKVVTILRDRRGGETRSLSLRQLREELESGVRNHDDSWRETQCACMW